MTTGVAIRFQSTDGQLFVRNSVVAARGYAIDLQPDRANQSRSIVADLQHVTFSASKAIVRMEASENVNNLIPPTRVFVDNCAMIAPVEFKSNEANDAAVVEFAGSNTAAQQFEWWGSSNGFARELKSLVRQSGAEPKSTPAQWLSVWGESNDRRLLTGPNGVKLSHVLPTKWLNFRPVSFTLDPNCLGATWADTGSAIGADLRVLEDMIVNKKGLPDSKSAPGGNTKSATPINPTTKSTPGF
jgi:hypothetical protein